MAAIDERRNVPRAEVAWPVTVFDEHNTIEGESRNISAKGLYICCDKPLPVNQVFGISIHPPNHQAIGVTGKVVWSDLYGIDDDKGIFGVGVCLIEISEEEQHVLKELISNYPEVSGDEEG